MTVATNIYRPTPVVKWVGGKRQLIPHIKNMMPAVFENYYEPFLGGGALFCELMPTSAIINDANAELIEMYRQIKLHPDEVCTELSCLETQYNQKPTMQEKDALYYELRQSFNNHLNNNDINSPAFAALLIFLNKAGFNGLYRVNADGMYNVPPAHRKTVKAYDRDNIFAMSKLLKTTTILCGDFEKACSNATRNDFVFFDSPYFNTFDTYQAGGFSQADHIRLFNLYKQLSDRGVSCMLTNNDCDFIKDLYHDFTIYPVAVKRMVNCNGNNRTGKEVIITNFKVMGV